MTLRGADPESYITEYTIVYEDNLGSSLNPFIWDRNPYTRPIMTPYNRPIQRASQRFQ